jgi:hypothetical protein
MNFQVWIAGTMGELTLVSVEVLHFLPMLNLSLCQTIVNANVGLVYWLVHGIESSTLPICYQWTVDPTRLV